MRTLVFCTAYAPSPRVWQQRYRVWLDAILAGPLQPDHILLIDDGSPCLPDPDWPDARILCGDTIGQAFTIERHGGITLFHFNTHLGRISTFDFPGWHRSFVFGALYAEALNAERVIHIESDAFVISARANAWLLNFVDGWGSLWSARYNVPEMAIQVAAGSGLRDLAEFARQPYAHLRGRAHETALPFTEVHRGLLGDRYGELRTIIPPDADYVTQISTAQNPSYLWAFGDDAPQGAPVASITLHFCAGGDGLSALQAGWAPPEPDLHWMTGAASTLRLPAVGGEGDAVLRLHVFPYLCGGMLTRQRLTLDVNGCHLQHYDVTQSDIVGCRIPAAALFPGDANLLRLAHPDAASPASFAAGAGDFRLLAMSVAWLTFARW
jgi:hypothetical protein